MSVSLLRSISSVSLSRSSTQTSRPLVRVDTSPQQLTRSNTLTSQQLSRSEIQASQQYSRSDSLDCTNTPTDSPLLKPIVFTLSNVRPDVYLNVFGQEIQVHSMVLSVHSPYFRKFLEDKLESYEWVTMVVDGGASWNLVRQDLMVSSFP